MQAREIVAPLAIGLYPAIGCMLDAATRDTLATPAAWAEPLETVKFTVMELMIEPVAPEPLYAVAFRVCDPVTSSWGQAVAEVVPLSPQSEYGAALSVWL
jgi:hypothetical protein